LAKTMRCGNQRLSLLKTITGTICKKKGKRGEERRGRGARTSVDVRLDTRGQAKGKGGKGGRREACIDPQASCELSKVKGVRKRASGFDEQQIALQSVYQPNTEDRDSTTICIGRGT